MPDNVQNLLQLCLNFPFALMLLLGISHVTHSPCTEHCLGLFPLQFFYFVVVEDDWWKKKSLYLCKTKKTVPPCCMPYIGKTLNDIQNNNRFLTPQTHQGFVFFV